MEARSKLIDNFQIIGFAVSTGVTIALVVVRIDPMQSTLLGLMLAVLTQLFDLQLRHANSEERLLQANVLSQALYRDPELLSQVRQLVQDYYAIENGWFDLFKLRARDAISECHRVLRSMAGGTMEPPPQSQFRLSVTAFEFARVSLKQVADFAAIKDTIGAYRGWYTKSLAEMVKRGVHLTQILIISRGVLQETFAQAHVEAIPPGTYFALIDELPAELDENYLIVDDRVVSFLERRADGTTGEKSISIIPVEVETMVKRFDQVLRYARKAEDVIAEVSSQAAAV